MIIEQAKRFSESHLWDAQRAYYDEQGVEAWSGDVPFYITSNPFIANGYASMVIRFIQDWVRQHPNAKQHPFYIIELGTGSGQFGFYVTKKLEEYRKNLHMEDIDIRYVMTDFTENNLKFWETHPALKPYIEKNALDFAVFDSESACPIHLTQSGVTLDSGTVENPMIVFANYLFDSIVSDVFRVKDGELNEALVSLEADDNNVKDGKVQDYQKMTLQYHHHEVPQNYYGNEDLDAVLNGYRGKLEDSHILYPIGSLRGLQYLRSISNGRLLLISSDKGYTELDELDDLDLPELDFHGSFSLMVNYHAIAQYFKHIDGDCYLQTPRDGLTTAVFGSGFKFADMPELSHAMHHLVEGLSPTDYFNFYENLEKTYQKSALSSLVSFLCFSHWDPYIFEEISERLEDLTDDSDSQLIDYLANNLPKIAQNFYYIPKAHDILFDLGVLMQELECYRYALTVFEQSQQYFGDNYALFFNMALCHYYQDEFDQAMVYFNQALEVQPGSKEILKWIRSIKDKQPA